jgi:hypothetical protein
VAGGGGDQRVVKAPGTTAVTSFVMSVTLTLLKVAPKNVKV